MNSKVSPDINIAFFDIIKTQDLYVATNGIYLIAFDSINYTLKWKTEIDGDISMNFDYVYLTLSNDFLFFSYDRPNREYFVILYNSTGTQLWKIKSKFAPSSKESISEIDGFIYFNSCAMDIDDAYMQKLDIKTGNIESLLKIEMHTHITFINETGIFLIGSKGIGVYRSLDSFEKILDNEIIPFQTKTKNTVIYLSESGKSSFYKVNRLTSKNETIKIEECGITKFDNSDRSYMEPYVYDDNSILIYNGKHKGMSFYSLSEKNIKWSRGKDEWTCSSALRLGNNIIVQAENTNDEPLILLFDNKGELLKLVETEVYPDKIQVLGNKLFVSSYDGLEIFDFNLGSVINNVPQHGI